MSCPGFSNGVELVHDSFLGTETAVLVPYHLLCAWRLLYGVNGVYFSTGHFEQFRDIGALEDIWY